jgi:hypothetical protein
MAPNRNDLNSSLHSLKSLDLSEQFKTNSKYQLLVPPAVSGEEAKIAVSCATIESNIVLVQAVKSLQAPPITITQPSETLEDAESYWHVPAEEDMDYFSLAHLEKMLINDAELRIEKQQGDSLSPKAQDSRTVPYWDWSETPTTEEPISKSAMIEMILKGESIRQMLTCESIGKHESQHRHRRSKETAPQIKPTHCNSMYDSDSYFYFPSYQEDKEAIISRILLEEGRRQVLLTDTIVENLVSQSALEETKEEPVTRNIDGAQNSYWAW